MKKIIIVSLIVFISAFVYGQTRQLDKDLPAGYTNSSYGVSPSGSAVYEIPIYTPKGSASMEPSISITYNSQAGIGVFGIGWDISGISVIERSGKTYFYDQESTDISYSNNDIFMLDGVRLELISGNYGADGSEYAEENEMHRYGSEIVRRYGPFWNAGGGDAPVGPVYIIFYR